METNYYYKTLQLEDKLKKSDERYLKLKNKIKKFESAYNYPKTERDFAINAQWSRKNIIMGNSLSIDAVWGDGKVLSKYFPNFKRFRQYIYYLSSRHNRGLSSYIRNTGSCGNKNGKDKRYKAYEIIPESFNDIL